MNNSFTYMYASCTINTIHQSNPLVYMHLVSASSNHRRIFQKTLITMRTNLEKYLSDVHHRPPIPSRPKPDQEQVEIITTFWHARRNAHAQTKVKASL